MTTLKNVFETFVAAKEVENEMKNVINRVHISAQRIGKTIGAIAYKCNTSSSWITFVMPDGRTKFGTHCSSTGDISVDVSDVEIFGNTKTVSFSEEPKNSKWIEFFNVPETVEDFSGYYKI